jgi:hypothetical protein
LAHLLYPPHQRAGGNRIPFQLNATTTSGAVVVYIPRSFTGYISLSTELGFTTLSEGLISSATTLAKVDSTSRYFIGSSLPDGDHDPEKWAGDLITIVSESGDIKLAHADERPKEISLEFTLFGTHFKFQLW